MKKKLVKISIISIVGILVTFLIGSFLVIKSVYSDQFIRNDRPDYNIMGGLADYNDLAGEYPRQELSFNSGKNKLAAYLYGTDSSKALVVVAHGLGGGADSYLPQIMHFVDNGFRVFAYDCTGSFDSEGESTIGFPQALLDLDAALTYISAEDELKGLKVLLFGHSWGGYAVANVLNYNHDISAVVTVSGVNCADDFITRQAVETLGPLGKVEKPLVSLYQRLLFGRLVSLSAVDGINKRNIPVLIIHGEEDELVKYEIDSIICRRDEITNPKVQYLTTVGVHSGHNNLFKSIAALNYIETVNQEYLNLYNEYNGEIPYDEHKEFYDKLDDQLISELDSTLMTEIIAFFEQAIA